MATATKTKVYRWVKDFLDRNEFYYEKDDKNKALCMGAPLTDKENSIAMVISCDEMHLGIKACFEHFADKKSHKNVMEYLMRVNYHLTNGCFVIDLDDGEVSFRTSLNLFEREMLSDDLIGLTLTGPLAMFNYYYKGLLYVMSGEKSPEEAVSEIFGSDNESCSCGCEH